MSLIFALMALVCSLASFVCAIMILIAAFQEEVVQGILCLCVPFYVLYYAFVRFQHPQKPVILGVWLGGLIMSGVLQGAAAAMR